MLDFVGEFLRLREAAPGRSAASANVDLLNAILRRQVVIANVGDGLVGRVIRDYTEAAREVAAALRSVAGGFPGEATFTQQRLLSIAGEIRDTILALHDATAVNFDAVLTELWNAELATHASIFTATLPADVLRVVEFSLPVESFAAAEHEVLGQSLGRWGERASRDLLDNLGSQIRVGMIQGDDMRAMIERTARVFSTSSTRAEATARTAVQSVANDAQALMYEANDDVVKGVQYEATFDRRTCPVCAGYDGREFYFADGSYGGRPRIPVHMQCRCVYVPILKSWAELGIPIAEISPGSRVSMNGAVPGTIGFSGWLRTQPRSVANDILGKRRADLWRGGDLSLRDFVNERTSRPFPLEQLVGKLEGASAA